MIGPFAKKYYIMVQIDSSKDAELIGSMEGFGHIDNTYSDDLYRENKVQVTIPNSRNFFQVLRQAHRYSKMGILYCVTKR